MKNSKLGKAKDAKFDEFYTQYSDIQREVNAYIEFNPDVFKGKTLLLPCDDPEWSNFTKFFVNNFKAFGLKKLISTSYAPESKKFKPDYQPTIFEASDPNFDPSKTVINGKIFILESSDDAETVSVDDLKWRYLTGDGDFQSQEVRQLFAEADIIVTNPPFSLFKEFLAQIMEFGKKFLIIANKNSVTYKETFPLIMTNQLWSGATSWSGGLWFKTMNEGDVDRVVDGVNMKNVPSIWLTNLDHGRRHQPLQLMTMEDNFRFSRRKDIQGHEYLRYENYDAIEIPYTEAIPSDYDGLMGVPISFLEKYNPEQFEILGMCENEDLYHLKTRVYTTEECKAAYFAKFGKAGTYDLNASGVIVKEGKLEKVYQRILIRRKRA